MFSLEWYLCLSTCIVLLQFRTSQLAQMQLLFNPSYHESFEILALLDPDIRQESCASISVIVAYIYVTKSLMHHTRFPFFYNSWLQLQGKPVCFIAKIALGCHSFLPNFCQHLWQRKKGSHNLACKNILLWHYEHMVYGTNPYPRWSFGVPKLWYGMKFWRAKVVIWVLFGEIAKSYFKS